MEEYREGRATQDELKRRLAAPEYDFLKNDPHLGQNIILLGMGGSYACGLEKPDGSSDLDVRGVALNSPDEILLGRDFEEVIPKETDTTIYSFNKFIRLLSGCSPNIIELLGLAPDRYLFISGIGQELIDHRDLFLSQRAAYTFGAYAAAQLRRLDHKSARTMGQTDREAHVLHSIENLMLSFPEQYAPFPEDSLTLYLDSSDRPDLESEIFMDVNLHHYPLRDYTGLWSQMKNVTKGYEKEGYRNRYAVERGKLGKHMAHLIRLYYMCFDILEKGEIITERTDEHDLLMSIRAGDFLDGNGQPVEKFYEMAEELEKRLDYDREHTFLPKDVDHAKVEAFQREVNRKIVLGTAGS